MPDLGKRQHTRVPIVLQGTLADVEQLAYITVVQPIRVPALFPESLVAGLGHSSVLPNLSP